MVVGQKQGNENVHINETGVAWRWWVKDWSGQMDTAEPARELLQGAVDNQLTGRGGSSLYRILAPQGEQGLPPA